MRLLTLLALSACVTVGPRAAPSYTDSFDLPLEKSEGWRLADQQETDAITLMEFLHPPETAAAWTEMVTVQSFDRARSDFPAPAAAERRLRAQLLARCPNAEWTERGADSVSVAYEWRVAGCAGTPDQTELARLIEGPHLRLRVAYTTKRELSDSARTVWMARLRRVAVVTKG